MRVLALVTTALLLVAGVAAPIGATSPAASPWASYRGAHISFETTSTALADYRVDGEPFIDSLVIESRSAARNDSSTEPSLSDLSSLNGSPLNATSSTRTHVRLRTGDGGVVTAHDDDHGVLLIRGHNRTQYVRATLPVGTDAVFENNSQVVATTANGSEATFSVIGNGTIDVDDAGNVVAELGDEGLLVVRTYHGQRSAAEREREQLIVDGVATGELYVMPRAGGTLVDTITYEPETSLNVTGYTRDSLRFRVDRSQRQGIVVLTNFEGANFTEASDVSVTVDGNAARSTAEYGTLAASANNGRVSRYLVEAANGSETVNGTTTNASSNVSTTDVSGNTTAPSNTSTSNATSATGTVSTTTDTASNSSSATSNVSASNATNNATAPREPARVTEVDLSVTHFSGHTIVVRPASQQSNETPETNASTPPISTTAGTPRSSTNASNGSNTTNGTGSSPGLTGTFNPGFGFPVSVVALFVLAVGVALALARRRR